MKTGPKPFHGSLFEAVGQDVRFALRLFKRHSTSTVVSIATLAIGIGATTAIFSLIYGVLWRPLPYPEPENLVILARVMTGENIDPETTAAKFSFWKEHQRSLDSVASHLGGQYVAIETTDNPERILELQVSADFFRVLRVEPVIGRFFVAGEDRPGSTPAVVLSYELWQRRFHSALEVLGKPLRLDGRDYTVVGVAPPGIDSTLSADLWTSIDFANDPLCAGDNLLVLARLADGVPLDQAQADLTLVAEQLRAEQREAMDGSETIEVRPYHREVVKNARPGLLILMAAVSLVLLIACANVANMLLARLTARRHELAVRSALGGDRVRIARQLLTESLCLSIAGSLVGIAFAHQIIALILRHEAVDLPRLEAVGIHGTVLLFTLAVTLLTALLIGLLPAWRTSRSDLRSAIQECGSRGASGGWERVSKTVMVFEVALSMTLLVGAALLTQSLLRLWTVDPGFEVRHLSTFQVRLDGARYGTSRQIAGFADQVTGRLGSMTQVETVAMCFCRPLRGNFRMALHSVDGHPKPAERYLDSVHWIPITAAYFDALKIPLLRGRRFEPTDTAGSPLVAIVNETFARKHFPDGTAVGQRLLLGWEITGPEYQEGWREIVGVVSDYRAAGLRSKPRSGVFIPVSQMKDVVADFAAMMPGTFLIRAREGARPEHRTIQDVVHEIDPMLPVEEVRSMRSVVHESVKKERFQTALLGSFALAALTLVTLGVYGIVSHSVAQRTREIGIRAAMGASPAEVMGWILARVVGLAFIGIVLGMLGALGLTRVLGSFLFGLEAHDRWIFLASPILLAFVTALAGYLPARRAANTDVMNVLDSR